jgi:GntR family transcriptional regulator
MRYFLPHVSRDPREFAKVMRDPRHEQLADELLYQIVDGTYAVGDRLPTEQELCTANDMARGTVRRALGHLEALGMISRRPGAGTTVVASAPVSRYQPVAQSADDIASLAAETRLLNPESGEILLTSALARRIGARTGSAWFMMQGPRVARRATNRPLCWSEHYLRADAPREQHVRGDFTAKDLANMEVEQTIYADLLESRIAEALDAVPGSAALVVARRHRNTSGKLISVGIHTHPADRYVISTTL